MKPATPTMQTTVGFFSPLATILCCACDCGDAGSAQWWDESTARSGERELAREFDACYRVLYVGGHRVVMRSGGC